MLSIYNGSGHKASILSSGSSDTTHTFPAVGGTILNSGTTSYTPIVTSGKKIGTLKIDNVSQDLYVPEITMDTTPTQDSTNAVTSNGIYESISSITTLHKSITLQSGEDLNDLYISQSPSNVDCVTRKWVIPSATVGASLLNLPATYKTVYANAEIEWHTVKNNGVGYQILTAGTNSSFQRFMRFKNANGWTAWYTLFDTDSA
jgi:hypothetical protein